MCLCHTEVGLVMSDRMEGTVLEELGEINVSEFYNYLADTLHRSQLPNIPYTKINKITKRIILT